jgi:hypothetical protein
MSKSKSPSTLLRLRPETRKLFDALQRSTGMPMSEIAHRLARAAADGRIKLHT